MESYYTGMKVNRGRGFFHPLKGEGSDIFASLTSAANFHLYSSFLLPLLFEKKLELKLQNLVKVIQDTKQLLDATISMGIGERSGDGEIPYLSPIFLTISPSFP